MQWRDHLLFKSPFPRVYNPRSIADASGSNAGLVNGTTTYTWDGNGNLLSNTNTVNTAQNKSFTYNLLNLPQTVTVAGGTVNYTYDATGNKLRKVSVISGVTKTTDYISGIEYDGAATDTLNFIQTEEGKAAKLGNIYDYTYYLGDNLDNTRRTFGTKTGAAVLYQSDDYYPFGLEISNSVTSPKNEYLYNRKELQEETGFYDFGIRQYDAVLGRWMVIDPLAEVSRRWSPYNYVMNNPVRLIDPDGMKPDSTADQFQAFDERIAAERTAFQTAKDPSALYTGDTNDSEGQTSSGSANNERNDDDKPLFGATTTYRKYLPGKIPSETDYYTAITEQFTQVVVGEEGSIGTANTTLIGEKGARNLKREGSDYMLFNTGINSEGQQVGTFSDGNQTINYAIGVRQYVLETIIKKNGVISGIKTTYTVKPGGSIVGISKQFYNLLNRSINTIAPNGNGPHHSWPTPGPSPQPIPIF